MQPKKPADAAPEAAPAAGLKQKLKAYCLEDITVMDEFPWNTVQPVEAAQAGSSGTPAEALHPPKMVESVRKSESKKEESGWALTIVSALAAVAVVLAIAGWSCAVVLGRQLQQEREAFQLTKSRADLLAAMEVSSVDDLLDEETIDRAAESTQTDVLPAGQSLWAFVEQECMNLIQTSQEIAAQLNLEGASVMSMTPITLHGEILEEMEVNGIPKYLILDQSGQMYLTYMEDGSSLTVGDFVYIRGLDTGSIEYVDENGTSAVLEEVMAEICQ